MLIKYYKNEELAYANRRRYRSFSFAPFSQEVQKSVLLGDGANTQIKTSKNNICNYVTIDDTRWYVTSYVYMNGGQVTLYLQRDVIGEFGFDNCFGKIERGYTDSFLKYRKELSVNEILKERKKLTPNTFKYGNYEVDTHNNELWGIMYFVKPTGLNPNTGEPYPEQVNINIPAFAPNYVTYPLLDNGAQVFKQGNSNTYVQFVVTIGTYKNHTRFQVRINFNYESSWTFNMSITKLSYPESEEYDVSINTSPTTTRGTDDLIREEIIRKLFTNIAQNMLSGTASTTGITFPRLPNIPFEEVDYTNQTVKDGDNFYYYTSVESVQNASGTVNKNKFLDYIETFEGTSVSVDLYGQSTTYNLTYVATHFSTTGTNIKPQLVMSSSFESLIKTYTRTQLSNEEAGNITIDTTQQLVDEPYSVLAFPLFNCKITGDSSTYNIQRPQAFMIFNTVIQYLSGENPYLIDAQIYPYCPVLTGVASQLNGYPFFKISSNTYTHNCEIQLLPKSDIKKEYIERNYSIVSPEQSGKFNFQFYDYINEIIDNNGTNMAKMTVSIKTALKPFGIVASAVIQPTLNSLMGITYASDLRGSQPTSNGFECSLSSNAFETYKRQNSNYQQIFKLQQDKLQLTHETEKVNENTSAVVNTITATAMGAIGGAALGGGGWTGIAGAVAGGAAAGATVGIANAIQVAQNDKLREFEIYQQQQNFDLQIGTIKNLPNSINRISSFNEIILQDFWFVIEIYECSDYEKEIVDYFIDNYGYGIGVFSFISNFYKEGWFIRSTLVTSNFLPNLHEIAAKEFMRGIYIYDKV